MDFSQVDGRRRIDKQSNTKYGQVNILQCSWELSHKLETWKEINNFNLQIVKHDNVDYYDEMMIMAASKRN